MIDEKEVRSKIKEDVIRLAGISIDVYFCNAEVHTKIDMISAAIWDIQNTNWSDTKAMEDRRRNEYLKYIKIKSCIAPAKIIGGDIK